MNIHIHPKKLSGQVTAPASKSDAHRCLILAALSDRKTQVEIGERSDDIDVTLSCIRALGAQVVEAEGSYTVIPGRAAEEPLLDCRDCGSTLRFLLPVAAACRPSARFTGRGRLPERPIVELLRCMEEHGAVFSAPALPLTVSGGLKPGVYTLAGDISSQYVSGLLMALPLLSADSEIRLTTPLQSAGYVDMTIETMERYSAAVTQTEGGFLIPGGQRYRAEGPVHVERDWSSAAFYLAAGAIGEGITVKGLSKRSLQKDRNILSCLTSFGAFVSQADNATTVMPAPLSGIRVDVSDMPDLVPILAVLACAAQGVTRLTGAARLRLKESDRLSSVSEMLRALGGEVDEQSDSLVIHGRGRLTGGTVDSAHDHRIAMAAAIAACLCDQPVTILGAECCAKSYPLFFDEYERLGGDVHVELDR